MSHTRREFLRGFGLTTAAGIGASIPAVAQTDDWPHWDAKPEHVTLSYSEDTLLEYAPRLVRQREARQKFQKLLGWTARSPEYDYDIHVFIADYTHQSGVSPAGGLFGGQLSDSHMGDTEPIYVRSDPETGETDSIVFDAYHWLAGDVDASSLTMDGNAPVVSVVSPWHFYAPVGATVEQAVALDEIADLTESFDGMLENGLAEDLHPGTMTDPATMGAAGRTHWWRTTYGDFSYDAFVARLLYRLGWDGADSVGTEPIDI